MTCTIVALLEQKDIESIKARTSRSLSKQNIDRFELLHCRLPGDASLAISEPNSVSALSGFAVDALAGDVVLVFVHGATTAPKNDPPGRWAHTSFGGNTLFVDCVNLLLNDATGDMLAYFVRYALENSRELPNVAANDMLGDFEQAQAPLDKIATLSNVQSYRRALPWFEFLRPNIEKESGFQALRDIVSGEQVGQTDPRIATAQKWLTEFKEVSIGDFLHKSVPNMIATKGDAWLADFDVTDLSAWRERIAQAQGVRKQ